MSRTGWLLGVAGLLFALATPAFAQTDADYPNRPIRIIVSVAAGGVLVPSEHHLAGFHDWVRAMVPEAGLPISDR